METAVAGRVCAENALDVGVGGVPAPRRVRHGHKAPTLLIFSAALFPATAPALALERGPRRFVRVSFVYPLAASFALKFSAENGLPADFKPDLNAI